VKTFAEAIAHRPAELVAEPQVHRVTLCRMVFAQIEVFALNPDQAMRLAEDSADQAQRTFSTAPAAHRCEIRGPRREDGSPTWIEVDQPKRE